MPSSANELEALEDEVGEEITKQELVDEMRKLNRKVDSLLDIISEAHDIIGDEPSKLDQVIQQNKEIANGIIALSNIIKDHGEEESSQRQPPSQPQRGQESPEGPAPPPPGDSDVPEPPQGIE